MTATTADGKGPRGTVERMRGVVTLGLGLVAMAATATTAAAQPGRAPAPYGPAAGPAAAPQPNYITPEEARLLHRGYYTEAEHLGGAVVGTFFGFGTGHMVQSRWAEKGWIFTFGEAASMGLMIYGMSDCISGDAYHDEFNPDTCSVESILAGAIALSVFRIWEVIDVWAHPVQHNARLRNLRFRLGYDRPPPARPAWGLYAAPPRRGDGAVAGVALRF